MVRKVYTCNICGGVTDKKELFGIYFQPGDTFRLDSAASTDGTHICFRCAGNLYSELCRTYAGQKEPNQ